LREHVPFIADIGKFATVPLCRTSQPLMFEEHISIHKQVADKSDAVDLIYPLGIAMFSA
jgi:hypothetical protein